MNGKKICDVIFVFVSGKHTTRKNASKRLVNNLDYQERYSF